MPRNDARNVTPSLSDDSRDKLLAALNWPIGKWKGRSSDYQRAPMYFDACYEWFQRLSIEDETPYAG